MPTSLLALVRTLALTVLLVGCSDTAAEPPTPANPTGPEPEAPATPTPPPPPPPPSAAGYSRAALAWTPGTHDTCTQQDHLRYTAAGPDGKLYPVWHPPIDPTTGCRFGHEHGRDPSGSGLADMGPVLFGYVNEALDQFAGRLPRHEDHVGHKVEWVNGATFQAQGSTGSSPTCDVLSKFHQGTHSADAFTNNLHELVARLRCTDGLEFNLSFLTANGPAGELRSGCGGKERIATGMATPPDSPTEAHHLNVGRSMGTRFIPTSNCVANTASPSVLEAWQTQNAISTSDGVRLANFAFYFFVRNPSRYFDPAAPGRVGRTVDVCFDRLGDAWAVTSTRCSIVRAQAGEAGMSWDDPRSSFNGADRITRFTDIRITNGSGIETWYSDPFGSNARQSPFPGSIRQVVRSGGAQGTTIHGPTVSRDYGGPGVHAPN